MVQAMPLLPVRQRFPAAEVAWVLNRELSGLLEGRPDLDEIIPFDRRGGRAIPLTFWPRCGGGDSTWCSICRGCCEPV